jgi:hypothetical protein
MAVVDSILDEELQRLVKLQRKNQAALREFPSGSVSIKVKSGRRYAYRAFREGGRVVTLYVGPADSPEVAKLIDEVKRRRAAAKELKAIERDIARIRKMLHA